MDLERIRLFVSGRVQGVGFRAATLETAKSLGLRGWVRNTQDGRVEILALGEAPRIQNLIDWCGQGPPLARVEKVAVMERERLDVGAALEPASFTVR